MKEGDRIEIQVGEHIFTTPPIPPKREILFHEKKKEDQYWQRLTDFPPFFDKWNSDVEIDAEFTRWDKKRLLLLSKEDTDILLEYREREIKRMREGIWFMNNGELTYITGGHYFALQHAAMKGATDNSGNVSSYGSFMDVQKRYCYFIEICKKTGYGVGGNCVKPKKTGITQLQALLILCDAMLNRTTLYRIMSTTEPVARRTNFGYIAYALEKLPEVITPSFRKNLGEVYFGNPDPSRQTSRRKKTDMEYLDSSIICVATGVRSFDSQTNTCAWVDEQSKIEIAGGSVEELHNTTLPTVMLGSIRQGYIIYTHYVSEEDNESFQEAKVIYYNSKLKTVDPETGKTASGLICFAMTELDGIFGMCDKYGMPKLKEIWGKINAEREQLKNNNRGLVANKRQHPTCEEDMWQEGAGNKSVFDNLRLGNKRQELLEAHSVGILPLDFNMGWTAKPIIEDYKNIFKFPGQVTMQPVTDAEKISGKPHGLFKWYRKDLTPDWFLEKHINNLGKDKKGKWQPRADCPFYAAVDPTNYQNASEVVVGSKNAIQIFILPTPELDGYFGKKVTNKRLMVSYLHRTESPRETLMHVIQTIMFFGCYILVESNMSWLSTKLKEYGFSNFLIQLNEDGVLEPYREFAKQKPFTSQKKTIGDYTNAGVIHLAEPDTDMDQDEIMYLEDEELIRQLMNYKQEDTTKWDAAVCYLIGQLGMATFLGWRQKQIDKTKRPGDRSMHQAFVGLVH